MDRVTGPAWEGLLINADQAGLMANTFSPKKGTCWGEAEGPLARESHVR